MLDAKFKIQVADQIGVAFADQDDLLVKEALNTITVFNNRNTLNSSMAAQAMGERYGQDIRRRGEIALEKMKRVGSILKISATDDFESLLTSFLEELLRAEVARLREELNNRPPIKNNSPSYAEIGNKEFDKATNRMFTELRSEITLYAAEQMGPTEIEAKERNKGRGGDAIAQEGGGEVSVDNKEGGIVSGGKSGNGGDGGAAIRIGSGGSLNVINRGEIRGGDAGGEARAPESTDRWSAKSNIVAILCAVAGIIAMILIAIYFGA